MGCTLRIQTGKGEIQLLVLNFTGWVNRCFQADVLNLHTLYQSNVLDII